MRSPTCSTFAKGMAYKAALAGLDLGGGKAVIIGDPATDKTEALLRAYGRFVQSLRGRYYTACESVRTPRTWTSSPVSRHSSPVVPSAGGAGDSRVLTASASSRACGRLPRWPGRLRACGATDRASPASGRSATTWSAT